MMQVQNQLQFEILFLTDTGSGRFIYFKLIFAIILCGLVRTEKMVHSTVLFVLLNLFNLPVAYFLLQNVCVCFMSTWFSGDEDTLLRPVR